MVAKCEPARHDPDMIDQLGEMTTGARAAIGGGLGLLIGSFVATVALRWPRGEGVAHGRSHCDGCGRTLGPLDLVPVLSFVLARGRCRACGGAIDPIHPATEIGAAAIGAVSLAVAPGWAGLAGALFGWTLLLLGLLDARHFWLPDRLTLPLLAAGLAAGAAQPGDRLIGAGAGYAVLAGLALGYRLLRGRQGLGGGDPKLFAAIGAWLGWRALPPVALAASLAGIALVLAMQLAGRKPAMTDRLPFGVLLAAAAWSYWAIVAFNG